MYLNLINKFRRKVCNIISEAKLHEILYEAYDTETIIPFIEESKKELKLDTFF